MCKSLLCYSCCTTHIFITGICTAANKTWDSRTGMLMLFCIPNKPKKLKPVSWETYQLWYPKAIPSVLQQLPPEIQVLPGQGWKVHWCVASAVGSEEYLGLIYCSVHLYNGPALSTQVFCAASPLTGSSLHRSPSAPSSTSECPHRNADCILINALVLHGCRDLGMCLEIHPDLCSRLPVIWKGCLHKKHLSLPCGGKKAFRRKKEFCKKLFHHQSVFTSSRLSSISWSYSHPSSGTKLLLNSSARDATPETQNKDILN